MCTVNVCRLCLMSEAPLHAIADTPLQEVYEKLTNVSLNKPDKPVVACSLCHWQLKKCHKLMSRALKADKLLTDMLHTGASVQRNLILMIDRTVHKLNHELCKSPMQLNIVIERELVRKGAIIEDESFTHLNDQELDSDVEVEKQKNVNTSNEELTNGHDMVVYKVKKAIEENNDQMNIINSVIDDRLIYYEAEVEAPDNNNDVVIDKMKIQSLEHTDDKRVDDALFSSEVLKVKTPTKFYSRKTHQSSLEPTKMRSNLSAQFGVPINLQVKRKLPFLINYEKQDDTLILSSEEPNYNVHKENGEADRLPYKKIKCGQMTAHIDNIRIGNSKDVESVNLENGHNNMIIAEGNVMNDNKQGAEMTIEEVAIETLKGTDAEKLEDAALAATRGLQRPTLAASRDSTVPYNNTILPLNNTTLPHSDTTLPHNDSTLPHNGTTLPHNDITLPRNDTILPHNDTTRPRNDTILPHNDTTRPHNDTPLSHNDTTHPDNDTLLPLNNTTVSHKDTTHPDNDIPLPHNDTLLPQNNTTVSHNDTTRPVNDTPLPHNATLLPHNTTTRSHNDTTHPDNDTTLPHNDTILPHNNHTKSRDTRSKKSNNSRKHVERRIECQIRGKTNKKSNSLKGYNVKHSNVKRYLCLICQRRFEQPNSLYQHLKFHSGQKQFQCAACGQIFKRKWRLRTHLRTNCNPIVP